MRTEVRTIKPNCCFFSKSKTISTSSFGIRQKAESFNFQFPNYQLMLNFQRQAVLAVTGTRECSYPDRESLATPLSEKIILKAS